jgi:hypothetical protein
MVISNVFLKVEKMKTAKIALPLLCSLFFIAGCNESVVYRVIGTNKLNDVVIDATNSQVEPKMKFDIYETKDNFIEIPVARIVITEATPRYSIGTLICRLDGSADLPKISKIQNGMICRRTTKETLKAEKKAYKYNKKALKRQYKLTKIKAKRETYEALDKVVQDTNEIDIINTSVSHQTIDRKGN